MKGFKIFMAFRRGEECEEVYRRVAATGKDSMDNVGKLVNRKMQEYLDRGFILDSLEVTPAKF